MTPAKRTALLGLLTGVAVTLSFLEGMLPALPFLPPGAKAGFSNIVIMFAAQFLGGLPALTVALLKSLFVLLTRGVTAFGMSLGGGMTATVLMLLALKKNSSFLLTGVVGALGHNTAQLAVAILLTGTPALVNYYPLLFLFALAAGAVTGSLLYFTYPALCRAAKQLAKTK